MINVSDRLDVLTDIICLFLCVLAFVLHDICSILYIIIPCSIRLTHLNKISYFRGYKQTYLALFLSFIYLLYIWTPLTDGTIGNLVREMAGR